MKRNVVLAVVLVLKVVFQTEAITAKGTVGKSVTIICSHSYADTNVKYFCRDPCHNADVLIKSNKGQTGKYVIEDKGNAFYVTISELEKKDAGIYWCGIERVGIDTYNKVTLTVNEDNSDNKQEVSHSKTIMYVGICLAVAVVVMATVLLIFFRLRKRKAVKSPGQENNDIENTTPFMMKKAQHTNTTSSAGEEGGDSLINTDQPGVLSSNISTEYKTQSNDLCYSTVSFNKHPTCSSVPPETELTTYSSIKPKQATSNY